MLGAVLSVVVAGPSPSAAAKPGAGGCAPQFELVTIATAAQRAGVSLEGIRRADNNEDGSICIKTVHNGSHTWVDNNRQKGKGDGDT
ncbi:hypothetical protein [Nannocystis radixulma]|uniref:hypothetical protein n=1 Tax=Nannocystis radixulma TaxID=2995305 RepID=UPI00232AB0B8|nr:hypothetical protein [Nannocystis radixulma]